MKKDEKLALWSERIHDFQTSCILRLDSAAFSEIQST